MLGELRESVGDDPEFLAELVDDFLADAPAQLESLREAATSGDAAGARRAAHTLKGNSRTFGAGELASLCQEAETAAGEGDLAAVLVPARRDRRRVGVACAPSSSPSRRSGLMPLVTRRSPMTAHASSPELAEARRRLAELESLVENSPVAVSSWTPTSG